MYSRHDLKIVQKRINRAIFSSVRYPDYLFGGIESRDYVQNARLHAGAKMLIALDVKNFYPNISAKHVNQVFQYFMKFPPDVAKVLTELTTLSGSVPQGACTSSHLANLVFFDTEHRLVRELHQKGLLYSRLLDDICISSKNMMAKRSIGKCIDRVSGMLNHRGFKLKADKTRVTSVGNPQQLMEVTGLWLNRGVPRAMRGERSVIRAEVWHCEKKADISQTDEQYHIEHNRVSGRISKLAYLAHPEARSHRIKLARILPKYSAVEVVKTERLVDVLCSFPSHDRDKYSYIEQYNEAMYRVGIVARTKMKLAGELRGKLRKIAPKKTIEEVIYG